MMNDMYFCSQIRSSGRSDEIRGIFSFNSIKQETNVRTPFMFGGDLPSNDTSLKPHESKFVDD